MKVRDINWNECEQIRAGIIPVIRYKQYNFYGFSLDSNIALIGDFGGHRENSDKDLLDTAIREYSEESLNLFDKLNRDILHDCYVLESPDSLEILLPVYGSMVEYSNKFRDMVKTVPENEILEVEIQELIWLSTNQLLKIIDNQHLIVDNCYIGLMYQPVLETLKLHRHLL